ncbi:hypothetical protein Bhyg_03725, partial [Pseudolycoriella hygida]
MVTLDTLEIVNSDLNDQPQKEGFKKSSSETDIKDSEHMKSYSRMIYFYKIILECIGFRATFDWNWKKEWRFWSHFILTQFSLFFIFYTMAMRYFNNNYVGMIEPLVILGITISVMLKYYTFLTYWKTLMALFFNYHSICRRTKDETKKATILTKALKNVLKLMRACCAVLVFAVVFYLLVPIK